MSKLKLSENIVSYLPFLNWLPILKKKGVIRADMIAGITVALVIIPQSMAYASLAGLPLQVGLYTAFIPVIMGALFGSSYQMSTGPVTIISLMTATALAPIASANPEGYIAYASLLALMIGLFYILLGTVKLGVVVDFLSHPVIIGFTNAIAIITVTSQASKIFGISPDKGDNYFQGIYLMILETFESTHSVTFIFGALSIFILLYLKKFLPKLPRVLILLLIAIITSQFIGYENLGGAVVGSIPEGLPNFSIPFLNPTLNLPLLSFDSLLNLLLFAVIIGLIGFTETISVAKYIGTQTGQRVSANRELFGQGLANISSSVFGGYAVAGSFSKTAVNMRAGAKTGFSSIITGIIVGITLLFFTPFLYHLPVSTLAAIIMVAVAHLIRIKPIIRSWKVEKHDGVIAVTTFALTLILAPEIERGIIIGVLMSIVFFIYRSMRPKLVEVAMYKDGNLRDIDLFNLKTSKEVSVYRFDGALYFINAGYFESKILDLAKEKEKLKFVIIDLEWVSDIDASGLVVLENVISNLEKSGMKVFLASIRVKVAEKFINSSFLKEFGKENTFVNIEEAFKYLEDKYPGDADLKTLFEYRPRKKKSEGKDILKKI